MASIQHRGNKYYVVVSEKNYETFEYEPKWIPFDTELEALQYRQRIEEEEQKAAQGKSKVIVTNATRTVEDLIWQYVRLVGKEKWGFSTYKNYLSRVNAYIIPYIGNVRLWECNGITMDEYFAKLRGMNAVVQKGRQPQKIGNRTMMEIHKFLKAMFNQAIDWDMMDKNPCRKVNSTIPKHSPQKRPCWSRETFLEAIKHVEQDEDYLLLVGMLIAVGTTMREGEICGLQWDRCHITEEDVGSAECRVYVDRILRRVDKDDLERKANTVKFIFPSTFVSAKSTLVLKEPKSEASTRVIWLPSTVAHYMNKLREQQEKQKAFLGADYKDYGLVIAMEDGRPLEGSVLNDHLQIIIKKYELPLVTFHSLRHTSTTYKLKISGGDVKSVQGDTGHADAKLVMDTYAEILDADRKIGAQHFEEQFFQGERKVEPALIAPNQQVDSSVSANDLVDLLGLLTANPELLQLIKSQASALQRTTP